MGPIPVNKYKGIFVMNLNIVDPLCNMLNSVHKVYLVESTINLIRPRLVKSANRPRFCYDPRTIRSIKEESRETDLKGCMVIAIINIPLIVPRFHIHRRVPQPLKELISMIQNGVPKVENVDIGII